MEVLDECLRFSPDGITCTGREDFSDEGFCARKIERQNMLKSQPFQKDRRTEGFLQQEVRIGENKFLDGGDE